MRKYLIMLAVTLGVALNSYGQESAKQIFESPKLKSEIAKHKIVAILPFKVSIKYRKQPKNFSIEANKEQENSMSKSVQNSMYTFLLRRQKDYTVDFQDVDKTNILLKKAGMLDKLDEFTKDEVAKALGADAVIGGTFESEQSKSEAGAIASAVVFGGFGGKTGSGTSILTINNGSDGELLWRFFKTMDDNIMSSTDDLIERMMRKVSRNFPYAK
ncbi:hypothetical protein [Pedobacter arcticus]|uniref:hypothetical protein n=1 Tax=Pedobacter arcticus TaxID=752140 RepID=UPI00037B78F8|nr:hypothetical protein [Pedobacter arcticus]